MHVLYKPALTSLHHDKGKRIAESHWRTLGILSNDLEYSGYHSRIL